jgi:hypothetical protein
VEIIVIGVGGQDRAVGGQSQGGQSRTLEVASEPAHEFRGEVLGVGSAAAVAADEEFAAGLERAGNQGGRFLDTWCAGGRRPKLGVRAAT